MTEDNWIEKLKEKKKEIEVSIAEIKRIREQKQEAEQKTQEKDKDEATRIIGLLNSKLNETAEVFRDPSLSEIDQPTVESNSKRVCLQVPVNLSTDLKSMKICFHLSGTFKGYGLDVRREQLIGFFPPRKQWYVKRLSIESPVTPEAIQNEVTQFLEKFKESIKKLQDNERQRLQRGSTCLGSSQAERRT